MWIWDQHRLEFLRCVWWRRYHFLREWWLRKAYATYTYTYNGWAVPMYNTYIHIYIITIYLYYMYNTYIYIYIFRHMCLSHYVISKVAVVQVAMTIYRALGPIRMVSQVIHHWRFRTIGGNVPKYGMFIYVCLLCGKSQFSWTKSL